MLSGGKRAVLLLYAIQYLTMSVSLILASQSPSRQRVLVDAGIRPVIRVSHVDEDAVVAQEAAKRHVSVDELPIADRVQILAKAKAESVARAYRAVMQTAMEARGDCVVGRPLDGVIHSKNVENAREQTSAITRDFSGVDVPKTSEPIAASVANAAGERQGLASGNGGPLIIGCDSMFLLHGEALGKPHNAEVARERVHELSGNTGELYTGHCVINLGNGEVAQGVSRATVHFAQMSDKEIDAYVASGEPLEVAGSFTLEGLGGAFIERIDGDPSGIIGLSLPLARTLVKRVGVEWTDLWNETDQHFDIDDPASTVAPKENVHQPGDGWVQCNCGRAHWGLNGAAGVLLACRDAQTGLVTDIVMQHRAAWSAEGGTWGIPGGAIADGENAIEGALRESYEEANITPEDIEVVGSYREDHGNWAYTTVFAFEKPGHTVIPAANDDESMEIAWVPIDDVPNRKLLTAMKTDWPHFAKRLEQLAEEHASELL